MKIDKVTVTRSDLTSAGFGLAGHKITLDHLAGIPAVVLVHADLVVFEDKDGKSFILKDKRT